MSGYDARCSKCTRKAINGDHAGCGERHWLLRVYPFDDMVVAAPTLAKARWQNYRSAREAGYFSDGFSAYVAALGYCEPLNPSPTGGQDHD